MRLDIEVVSNGYVVIVIDTPWKDTQVFKTPDEVSGFILRVLKQENWSADEPT